MLPPVCIQKQLKQHFSSLTRRKASLPATVEASVPLKRGYIQTPLDQESLET